MSFRRVSNLRPFQSPFNCHPPQHLRKTTICCWGIGWDNLLGGSSHLGSSFSTIVSPPQTGVIPLPKWPYLWRINGDDPKYLLSWGPILQGWGTFFLLYLVITAEVKLEPQFPGPLPRSNITDAWTDRFVFGFVSRFPTFALFSCLGSSGYCSKFGFQFGHPKDPGMS